MKTLSIDIETYSSYDLRTVGVYKYVEAPDFEILLFAYAVDDDPVQVIDLANFEAVPSYILDALTDPAVIKTAYNANFERTCIAKFFGMPMDPSQWRCSSVHALTLGLPGHLEAVAQVLGLKAQKDTAGKNLIKYFSVPCKPTKTNGGRTRNLPHHDPVKWQQFIEYNRQDVEVERELRKKLERYPVPVHEWKLWELDQRINDEGVRLDPVLVKQALACDAQYSTRLEKEARELTGLENPNSVKQLTEWLEDQGLEVENGLGKDYMPGLLEEAPDEVTRRALELRQEMSKTSVDKYSAMDRCMCADERARGLLQFCGANRTGRWCLTGDHEVLTPEGWIRLDEWKGGQIACWNPKGELVSFQKAELVSFDYSGPMYEYSDKRIAQVSTPDHKMYVKRRYGGEWITDTVENMVAYRPSIPFTGVRITNRGLEHGQLRVLVMVQADGHYTADGSIRLAFKKERKFERCKELLRKAGIVFSYSEQEEGKRKVFTIHSRHVPLWLRLFRGKTFGPWLFDESADVFFDELAYWDGCRSAVNSIQYCTCNKQNADMVQAFAHLSGRCALMKTKDRRDENANWQTAYYVDIWLTPINCHEIRNKPRIFDFSGKVYCAVTQTGYFLVRRDGRVWVTGNSGRLIQVQNLPQNKIPDLALARQILRDGDFDLLEMLFGSPPFVLSQLIRTAFVPSPGCRFVVADFSAIEARVIAWLADENWVLDVFRGHGKIYEATAAQMFKVPIETIAKGGENYHLRAKGKVATLSCGYQGGPDALIRMGALKNGLTEEELPGIVKGWRDSNPHIVKLWYLAEKAAVTAVQEKRTVKLPHGVRYRYENGWLFADLPSGRSLAYVRPEIKPEPRFDKDGLTYEGVDQMKKTWCRQKTYGGKLVENLVQAIARDCLAVSMMRLAEAGYKIRLHIHDEVVLDVPKEQDALQDVIDIMSQPIEWAPGLPLRADGYETEFYRKD